MTQVLALLALGAMLAAPAPVGDDDELAPLSPVKAKAKPKPKAPARPRPAPARKAPPPAVRAPSPEDELAPLTPVATDGELAVRLAEGIEGAVLLVDGKALAALPAGAQRLRAGEHQVLVRRPGFAPFTRRVQVAAGKVVDLEVRLQPVAAVLAIEADQPGAQVLLNGRYAGTTPLLEVEVPPGQVELVVMREGFLDERQRLSVVAGRDYPVTVQLSRAKALAPVGTAGPPPPMPPVSGLPDAPVERVLTPVVAPPDPVAAQVTGAPTPLVQRWYFWAGVAVVVAAAAAGTVVGVMAAQAPRQRPALEVCTGVCDACIGLACAGRGFQF
jgi:hypothetical protein